MPEEHLSEGQGYLPERHKTPQSAENVLQTKHIQQRADAPDVGGKPAGMPYALNVASVLQSHYISHCTQGFSVIEKTADIPQQL